MSACERNWTTAAQLEALKAEYRNLRRAAVAQERRSLFGPETCAAHERARNAARALRDALRENAGAC